jgi:uncharacterized protein YigE (DUF2233 family)
MKNSILFILIISLSSCVVSRKDYDKLYHEKHEVENQLHKKNIELISTKLQSKKEIKSLRDSSEIVVDNLKEQLLALDVKIDLLHNEIDRTHFSKSSFLTELEKKDSINSVYLGKLKWIRKQNTELKNQLAVANEEKQLVNKLLLDCKHSKTSDLNKTVGSSSSIVYNKKGYLVFVAKNISKIKMGLKNSSKVIYRSIGNLLDENVGEEIIYASNGGMYLPSHEPQGLYIENGKLLKALDKKEEGYGNFYMQPNGIFMVKNDSAFVIKSTDFKKNKIENISYATQSGPMLLIDGKINPKFAEKSKHLNIRNGVGVNDKNEVVLIKSETPVTFYEMAKFLKDKYGCENALYLDGVISRTYMPEIDKNDFGGDFGVMIYVTK